MLLSGACAGERPAYRHAAPSEAVLGVSFNINEAVFGACRQPLSSVPQSPVRPDARPCQTLFIPCRTKATCRLLWPRSLTANLGWKAHAIAGAWTLRSQDRHPNHRRAVRRRHLRLVWRCD